VIDLYSHFGTRYSYATIASVLGRAMRDAGLLRGVYNLDSEWHPDYADLQAIGSQTRGTHLLVIAAPSHYVADLGVYYRRDRAALFVSPNTDTMAKEHIQTVSRFGDAIATSLWCQQAVEQGLLEMEECGEQVETRRFVLPLGVDESFAALARAKRRESHVTPDARVAVRALHLTTDQCWPGRKGTEELLAAWATVAAQRTPRMRRGGWDARPVPLLTVHAPQSLERDLMYSIADHGLHDYVSLVTEERGVVASSLADLYAQHDVVVLPSRCEGFGMMILAALVARVPLITTYVTGQADFLSKRAGWLGVPTCAVGDMAYETGSAPIVEVPVLANLLELALDGAVLSRLRTLASESVDDDEWGTWKAAMRLWVEHLRTWTEETA
jgi:glycosyltransferase involved in cell wall biosynthesis